MAIEALGAVILKKLTDLLIDDSIAFDNVIDQIEDIRIQLRHMRGFLIDAELSNDPAAVSWATDYLGVLYSAEDEIENYALSLSASGRRRIGFFQRRGFTLFAAVYDSIGPGKSLRCALDRLAGEIGNLELRKPDQVVDASLRGRSPNPDEQVASAHGSSLSDDPQLDAPGSLSSAIGLASKPRVSLRAGNPNPDEHEIGDGKASDGLSASSSHGRSLSDAPVSLPPIEKRLKSLNSFPFWYGSRSPGTSKSPRSSPGGHQKVPITYPDQEGPSLIGFTRDKEQLVGRLTEGGGGVIPLVGPAGSGKTTLVQEIYNLRKIKTRFDCRAWIHVPDESITVSHVLDNLLQQVLKSKEGGILNEDQLITRVQDSLKDKTYLVVLDHLRDVQLWKDLKSAFPKLDAGDSKVILITRDGNVASSISNQEQNQEQCKPHCLDKLCDKHSWDLLIEKSYLGEEGSKLDGGIKEEILGKCEGVPLNIVLLGGLLSTKGPSSDEWKWYLSQPNWRGMKIMTLSYNDLPAHSKLCLLYMALFPNELDIPVRRLYRLWLAEGFIRRSPGIPEEDTVEECFDDLVQRNLIKISKLRSDGTPRKCRLPRALREYLSTKAWDISLFYITQGHQNPVSTPKLDVRRVIEYVEIRNDNTSAPDSSPSYENLRSYISFNSQRNDTPAVEVGNFISKIIGNKGFGVLRVLDLEGVYKPTLPETLKQLFHLRYLGLRWTFIDHLPKSVGDLPYLETLDLKRTYISSLPSSIWKLEHLRHLNLPGIRLDYTQKKGRSSLNELRTLVGLIVDDKTYVEEELNKLCGLRELDITCQLSLPDDLTRLIKWIQKLTNLRFLWLKSKDKMGRPSKINLQPLSELCQLSHVSILGNIPRLPALSEFPPNLKILALSVSRLNADPMPILSKLPYLSVLRLLAESYLGVKMECPGDGFKNLRVLKLWMLKELVEWTVEKGGMPRLKELFIRHCLKLKQIPSQLLDQITLEELTLTAMPEEFVEQVKREKQSHTILTENNYKFTPLPWENDPDLWNE